MAKTLFSIEEAFSNAWKYTKANLVYLIVCELILGLISSIQFLITRPIYYDYTFPGEGLIFWIISSLVYMGYLNAILLITDGIKPGYDQLYINWRQLFSWIVAHFLFGVLVVFGTILFIIPGIYIIVRYSFLSYSILDKKLGPIEAFEYAGKLSENIRWSLFFLWICIIGINFIGALLLGIGVLFTHPISLLALAYVYRKVQAAPKTVQVEVLENN